MRLRVFALTWLAYASYYLGRKNFSVSKTAIEDELHLGTMALALVDTGFLGAYAIGQFAMGVLGDRLGPRRLIGVGMLTSGLLVAVCGLVPHAVAIGAVFAVNGFAQASGWPGTVKAMTPWFTSQERGRVMGLWSTCYQVGGLVAGAVTAAIVSGLGWRAAFLLPAAWVAAVGGLVLLALPEAAASERTERKEAQRRLVADPTLWSLGVAYFCLKLIRYSLLFWLPYYLERSLGYARGHAGYQSLAFEAGGIVGAVAVGTVSDRVFAGRRGLAGLLGCVGLVGALLVYVAVGELGAVPNLLALGLVGFSLFGPDALISGAAAQDAGGKAASATAAGFINGMGSVGAVFQGLLTAQVAERWGWERLFIVFVGLAAIAVVALVPRALADRTRPSVLAG